ncbi:MAG: hypothetical protein CL947_00695 [Epsilonproteobacteria bacterium]|nr:hypothetical protein [Campylobacterota bacterium]
MRHKKLYMLIGLLTAKMIFAPKITASYTVHADYSRTFTRALPVFLSKFTLGKILVKSWALNWSTAPLWALPVTAMVSLPEITMMHAVGDKIAPYTPDWISKYLSTPDVTKINRELNFYKYATIGSAIAASVITAGTIWAINKYKQNKDTTRSDQNFAHKYSNMTGIISNAKNPLEAAKELKRQGYSKKDIAPINVQSSGKFTPENMQIIAQHLS